MTENIKHRKITVSGRVQGVFYRASTSDKARELGIYGYVRNQGDGSVYIEAEGPDEKINALIDWCRQGPAYAEVESVKVEDGDIVGFTGFEVRH